MNKFNLEGARLCFYLALKKLDEGDIDLAIHRAKEAVELLENIKREEKEWLTSN